VRVSVEAPEPRLGGVGHEFDGAQVRLLLEDSLEGDRVAVNIQQQR
jgi:hypothetical protein